jgi:hypothetical protein
LKNGYRRFAACETFLQGKQNSPDDFLYGCGAAVHQDSLPGDVIRIRGTQKQNRVDHIRRFRDTPSRDGFDNLVEDGWCGSEELAEVCSDHARCRFRRRKR